MKVLHMSSHETTASRCPSGTSRRFCVKQVARVGIITLFSRVLGFARELLLIRVLGKGALSDAFITAFRLPNMLYKVCAGGALSPAVVPCAMKALREDGQVGVSRLMTLLLGISVLLLSVLCGLIIWKAEWIVSLMAPGFVGMQQHSTIVLARIMTPFVILITMSALYSEALRMMRHFTVPSLGQPIFNCVHCVELIWCWWQGASLATLGWIVIVGGIVQLIPHIWAYSKAGFIYAMPTRATFQSARALAVRVIPSATTASMGEIGSFVEGCLASYLPVGSVSLLSYTNIFLHMPLGILATACATVTFPDMVRVSTYAPRRLGYLMCEVAKLVWWVLFPCAVLMGWYSEDIFRTLYQSPTFQESAVMQASYLLIIRMIALVPLALNKFLLNCLYALHELQIPSIISLGGTCIMILAAWGLMPLWGVYGIAAVGVGVAVLRMVFLWYFLHRRVGLHRYWKSLAQFMFRSATQACLYVGCGLSAVGIVRMALRWTASPWALLCADGILLWVWMAPLVLLCVWRAWSTRRWWGLSCYFFNRI